MLPRVHHIKAKPPLFAGETSEPRQGVDEKVQKEVLCIRNNPGAGAVHESLLVHVSLMHIDREEGQSNVISGA